MKKALIITLVMTVLSSCGILGNRDKLRDEEFLRLFGDDTKIECVLPELDITDAPMYKDVITDVLSRIKDVTTSRQRLFTVSVYGIFDGSTVCVVELHDKDYNSEKTAGWESKYNRGYVKIGNDIFLFMIPPIYYEGFKETSSEMTFKLYNKNFECIYDPTTFHYRKNGDKFQYLTLEEWDAIFDV